MYQVTRVLEMRVVVALSSDWGEALKKHPLNDAGGKDKKGKVLRMFDPQEGFVQR